MTVSYPPLAIPLMVDVTTGDRITPNEIEYSFQLLFDERSIPVFAYNLETILAEKLETVLSRNVANTRPRDFYDIHILYTLHGPSCNITVLKSALHETAMRRGSRSTFARYQEIIESILKSSTMQGFWEKYRKEYDYAADISFTDTCNSILTIMDKLEE
jgi:predicted nucleotidyltransferase component of viral defense system